MEQLDRLLDDVFAEEAETLTETTAFADVAGWDSLKHVELVVGIEKRFGVDLTASEIARLTSKQAIRNVLAARRLV